MDYMKNVAIYLHIQEDELSSGLSHLAPESHSVQEKGTLPGFQCYRGPRYNTLLQKTQIFYNITDRYITYRYITYYRYMYYSITEYLDMLQYSF